MAETPLKQELEGCLKRLKGLTAHVPPERTWPQIQGVLDSFFALTAKTDKEKAELKRAFSRMAFLVYARARAAEAKAGDNGDQGADGKSLIDIYLAALAGLGPVGTMLLTRFLRRRADKGEDPGVLLSKIPEPARLLVVNRILSNPALEPKSLRQAALDELTGLKNTASSLIQEFLRERSRFTRPAAFAVQEALMAGPFGKKLLETLDDQLFKVESGAKPDETLEDAVLALACLCAPKSGSRLGPLLQTKDVPALLWVLKAIQRACAPGDMKPAREAAKLLMDPDRRVQACALQTLTKLAPKGMGRLFAALYKKDKPLRGALLAHLPLLTHADYKCFIQALPKDVSQGVPASLFSALARLDPLATGDCLDAAAQGSEHGKAFKALKALLPKREPLPAFDAEKAAKAFEAPAEKPEDKKEKRGKPSLFSRLGSMGNGGETLSVQFGDGGGVGLGGGVSDYSGKKLTSPVYEAQTLQRVKFAKSFLQGAVFKDCTLKEADFGGSLFKDAQFVNCVFKDCDFSRAQFFDCSLENTTFSRCGFQDACLVKCALTLVDVRESNFQGAGMHAGSLSTSRFTAVDFSHFSLAGTKAAGVEFIHCHFQNASLKDLDATDCTFTAPDFAACRVEGLATDSPVLLELEEQCYRSRAVRMEQEAGSDAPGNNGPDKETAGLAAQAVKNWFVSRDLRAAERVFLANNERRINWCIEKLGPRKYEFFRILPFLLHSEVFERSRQNVPILPFACRMAEYQPDYTTLETAKKYFPGAELPKTEPDPVFIEALFTIGSVGTIAQSSDSDLDYWVCFDPEGMPEMLMDGLAFKLQSLEQWAGENFGLEVHFFLMDQTLIQNNNFGFSDSESSGSAQALLLKEEFYRTAVSVAGKKPVWWLTPPEATEQEYADILGAIGRSKNPDRFIDLGNLEQIPLEEFFGASLWQIVKALKSPFKSIMKFALLEKYTAEDSGGKNRLLSDLFKENLRSGKTSIMRVDPYMLMFYEVGDYYTQVCDRESLELVRLSFFLKANVRRQIKDMETPVRAEEREIRDLAAGQVGSLMCIRDLDIGEEWDFGKIISFGGMVNKFIIRTYLKVRDKLAKNKDIVITPEDLTKLGRKISSTFSRREHKIEHVPFVSLGDSSFRVLHFRAYGKKMGQPSEWYIQGAQKVSTSKRLDLVDLKKGGCLAELLVWLTANGVYSPEMSVKGDYSISPVTTRDIKDLMDKLLDFFPPSETFNTDIGETLNPERIVKVLFVLNLIKPREQNHILEVSIIYSTNWGELFCRTLPAKGSSLQAHPLEFLRRNAPQACLKEPVMEFFVPDRSKCPELMLS